jgi:hypothetical protein
MTNDIVTSPFGKPVALTNAQAMATAVAASAQQGAIGSAPDGSVYLNFTGKRGVYEFGREKEDLDASEIWLVNIASFEDGYVCWKGGKTAATRMANIYSGVSIPAPASDEMGPFNSAQGEGWFQAKSMVLRSVEADDRQAYWKINSKSGVAVFADLLGQVAERLRAGMPAWPLIKLGKEKFEAQGQKNYKPVVTVYGWLSDAACGELAANPDADIDALIEASGGATQAALPARRRRGTL